MSTIVIKKPNLGKMLAEQHKITATLTCPPITPPEYLAAPLLPLTNTYHERGSVKLEPQKPEVDMTQKRLSGLMQESSRINLDVEKTLELTQRVLSRACVGAEELSETAQQLLAGITKFGEVRAALMPPPE
ncbi:hypothetical protein ERJ75_001450800 [Trypanosoma vivax]|nr:hypothetical protein TRVL_00281 [Trypanosoma vivax]KAH8607101.1 hypothetical protein ERJ75_001450800 [Trypanosoma vivax]